MQKLKNTGQKEHNVIVLITPKFHCNFLLFLRSVKRMHLPKFLLHLVSHNMVHSARQVFQKPVGNHHEKLGGVDHYRRSEYFL